jgi:hypothetical protein
LRLPLPVGYVRDIDGGTVSTPIKRWGGGMW